MYGSTFEIERKLEIERRLENKKEILVFAHLLCFFLEKDTTSVTTTVLDEGKTRCDKISVLTTQAITGKWIKKSKHT